MARLDIDLLPAFTDNYIYLVREPDSGTVAVVDPGEAGPVLAALEARGWGLDLILNTHHHADHIGGDQELKERYGARLIGPAAEVERIPDMDQRVGDGDRIRIGDQTARVFFTPGHTRGHIAFWFEGSEALFCGDTLFALGCGRLFEGTPAQMWTSLKTLRALPDRTRIYCGHEYTQSNARFALAIDPGNASLRAYAEEIAETRAAGGPTIPAQLGREKLTNPFLRADAPDLQAALGMTGEDPTAVFAAVRARKDNF